MKFYHVVTEKPMKLNQIILFDDKHRNGVAKRIDRVIELSHAKNNKIENLTAFDKIVLNDFEHWTNIAKRELILEKVRKKQFSEYPSRLSCLYVSTSLNDAEVWSDYFIEIGRVTHQIVELECDGNHFTGDAHNCWYECPLDEEALEKAYHYWSNCENRKDEIPIYETIIDGNIKVNRIIKEFKEKL